jgi:hypothetical protein
MARNDPPDEVKTRRLNASDTEQAVASFHEACATVGIEHTEILRSLAAAFTEHVRQHKRVTLPLRLAPPDKLKEVKP